MFFSNIHKLKIFCARMNEIKKNKINKTYLTDSIETFEENNCFADFDLISCV